MKSLSGFPLRPLIALVCFFPSVLAANLLEHGSFDVISRGKFAGWHVPRADADGVFSHGVIRQDAAETPHGEGVSLALDFHGQEKDGDEEIIFRVRPVDLLSVSPEGKYRLTFHAKAKGTFLLIVEAFTANADKKKKDVKPLQFAVAPEWQAKSLILDIPPEGLFLGFMIKVVKTKGMAGTLWLDEFSVEEASGS